MELLIKPYNEAAVYQPIVPTLAMRIMPPGKHGDRYLRDYALQGNYVKTLTYRIHHNEEPTEGQILIDEVLAAQIRSDFERYSPGCEALLVHCVGGKVRSPAFAIALNQRYNLGHSTAELMQQYPQYNKRVFRMITGEQQSSQNPQNLYV